MFRHQPTAASCVVCLVVLVIAPVADAQIPPATAHSAIVRDIDARLQSGDPRQAAWGAFIAAQYHIHKTAALWSAMIATPEAGDWILDALIQMRASIPASQLLATYDRWPIQTLVLLGDSRIDRDEVLHELFKRARGDQWFAIANLLMEARSPGLAVALLRELRLTLHISIVNDGSEFSIGSGSGIGIGCGIIGTDDGYPPRAYYRFSGPERGAVVLAHGPHPVHYLRTMTAGGSQSSASDRDGGGPSARDRVQYLAAFAGFTDLDMPIRAETSASVQWTSQEAFEGEVAAQRADIEFRHRLLLQRLIDYKRLTPADAEWLQPAIDVQITDRRK